MLKIFYRRPAAYCRGNYGGCLSDQLSGRECDGNNVCGA